MTSTNEFESIERDLEAAFAAAVPAMHFDPPTRSRAPEHRRHSHRWQFAGAGVLAAGFVAAIAFLPGYLGGAKTVNAEELLSRSANASASLKSSTMPYHLRASFQGKGVDAFVTDTWSFGTQGNRSETRSADGTLVNGQVATPEDYWMFATVKGQFRVAHVAGATDRLQDFAADSDSLQGLVDGLVIPGCQEAVLDGSAKVAGRDAHVVEVRPTPTTCKSIPGRPETEKVAASIAQFGSYTVWIDKETNIQLKVESRDPSGAVTERFTAEAFETGGTVSDSVLNFTPPAGTTVIEVPGYSEAKHAVYGGEK
ncbi:MAG: hypothetical protein ABI577_18355 [bacterium]